MKVARPDARPAAWSPATTRRSRSPRASRAPSGVRARDEPPRAAARAQEHALREPDRARRAGQLLHGARPRARSPSCCARNRFFSKTIDSPSVHAEDRQPPAHVRQPQHARAQLPLGQRRQDRPHQPGAATCSSARASRNGIQLVCAVLGTPSEAARDADTMALLRVGFPRFQRITRACGEGAVMATRADPLPRAAPSSRSSPAAPCAGSSPRGQRDDVSRGSSGAPDDVDRADPSRASAFGAVEIRPERPRRRDACRWSPHRSVPARRPRRRRPSRWFTSPLPLLLVGRRACRYRPAWRQRAPRALRDRRRAGERPAPHDRHRHAQHRHRQDAVGAELPARPPPPHGRADDDAGRQGRQRRARAQGARRARDRDGLRRRRRPARASSTSSRSCRC